MLLFVLTSLVSSLYRPLRWVGIIATLFGIGGYILGDSTYQKGIQAYQQLEQSTNGFSGKYTITGIVEKQVYQKDRTRILRLSIDNIDNGSTYIFPDSDKKTSIFVEVPKNLTLHPNESIQLIGTIRNNISFPLQGYDRYAFFHGGYGYIYAPTFSRLTQYKPGIIEDMRAYWSQIFLTGFPREVA